jgi:hypothetical protein
MLSAFGDPRSSSFSTGPPVADRFIRVMPEKDAFHEFDPTTINQFAESRPRLADDPATVGVV